MMAVLITIILTYLIVALFGYVVHWSLHQSWAGRLNQKHMTHHLKLYPPEDFLSEKYRHAGKDNTVITFTVASIPVVLVPLLLWWLGLFTVGMMIASLVVMGSMGFLHDYIHNALHIRNHWMSRVPVLKDIFHKWGVLHYLHHVNMEKNYGIFVFHWDHVFRTFWRKTD